MNSFGLAAAFMNTNTAVHGDIGMVQNGDLVIILTKSGDTSESVYLTSLLEQRNADLWLLSFQRNSTLAERIPKHVILDLEHEGDAWDITPNNSTTVNLIILQGLAIALSERMGVTLADFKKNHPVGKCLRTLWYLHLVRLGSWISMERFANTTVTSSMDMIRCFPVQSNFLRVLTK